MPKPMVLSEQKFREDAKAGTVPAEASLRKGFVAEAKAVSDADRCIDFVISTDAVDRMGDTIAVDGWKLADYRKNPVVLWAHDSKMMPVAKASNIRVEDGKLKARAEFMPREISGFADAVYRAIKAGFLNAVSVGFSPIKYAFSEEDGRTWGIDFMEQELLEFSVVPIPANAEALVEARSADGFDTKEFEDWAEKLLEASGRSIIATEKMASILAIPTEFRSIAKKIPDAAKGARGQLLRCANMAEKIIGAPVVEPAAKPNVETLPVEEVKSTPRLDMARRRLSLIGA